MANLGELVGCRGVGSINRLDQKGDGRFSSLLPTRRAGDDFYHFTYGQGTALVVSNNTTNLDFRAPNVFH